MPSPALRPLLLCFALLAPLAACASSSPTPATSVSAKPGIGAEEARRIAEKEAEAAGYSRDEYRVVSVKKVEDEGSFKGMWQVFFEHVPPTPPGGHASVYVNATDGTAKLFHGR